MKTQFNSASSIRGGSVRHSRKELIPVLGALIGLSLTAPIANGQTFPSGFTATTLVSTDLPRPIRLCFHADGRLFIALQGGAVRVWKEDVGLLPTPYYQFPTTASGESGLLGIALNPDPTSEDTLFAFYSGAPGGSSRVVRIRAVNPADDVAIPNSETLIVSPSPTSGNHNGGGLQFGPDGKLYVSVGDRGGNPQTLTNFGGKILRFNADGSIPGDNPTSFQGISGTTTDQYHAIYAIGLRHPFRLAIQPVTGRIFFNDVGSASWEEINECFAGRNYGWPTTEGPSNPTTTLQHTRPLYSYPHGTGANAGRAIVGGVFYNPPVCALPPEYYNSYFFAEYYSAWIKRLNIDDNSVASFASAINGITDMQFDPQGRLFLVSNNLNRLIRLEYTDPLPPTLAREPKSVRVCLGETARFSIVPSGNVPLTYQWRQDDVDLVDGGRISGANGLELIISDVQSSDAGDYTCLVVNSLGNAMSHVAELSIGMTGGSRTGNEIGRFIGVLQAGTSTDLDRCHFDFDGNGQIELADMPGLIDRLLE